MNRVAIFHNLRVLDLSMATLKEEVRETFGHQLFRTNLFHHQHKIIEVISSLKSQSLLTPIDIVFHDTCPQGEVSKIKAYLQGNLVKFKLYFHYGIKGEEAFGAIKKSISERPKREAVPKKAGGQQSRSKSRNYKKHAA